MSIVDTTYSRNNKQKERTTKNNRVTVQGLMAVIKRTFNSRQSNSSSAMEQLITCFENLLSHKIALTMLQSNLEPLILKKYDKATERCCSMDKQRYKYAETTDSQVLFFQIHLKAHNCEGSK